MNVHRSQQADLIKKVTRVAKGILVTSILSLLLVLVLVTLPKIESSRFKLGICSVTATKLITAQDKRLRCDCIKRNTNAKCTIYYPCLQIYVSYNNRSQYDALVVRDRRQMTKECSYILRDSECKTTQCGRLQTCQRFPWTVGLEKFVLQMLSKPKDSRSGDFDKQCIEYCLSCNLDSNFFCWSNHWSAFVLFEKTD